MPLGVLSRVIDLEVTLMCFGRILVFVVTIFALSGCDGPMPYYSNYPPHDGAPPSDPHPAAGPTIGVGVGLVTLSASTTVRFRNP